MAPFFNLFGPSREEVWRQLCREIDATYVDGGFWKGDKVVAREGEWEITLDTYSSTDDDGDTTTYTRMRAPYVNRDNFRFSIGNKTIFSGIGKALGMQDVTVGYPRFDDQFIIKGTDQEKLRELFSNDRIRSLIFAQPDLQFRVLDNEGLIFKKYPEAVDALNFTVAYEIKDIERLKLLYDLFAETLEQLCKMGSAYDPGLSGE